MLERARLVRRPAPQARRDRPAAADDARRRSDPLTRDMYVGRLAEVVGVDRDVLAARDRAGRDAPTRPRRGARRGRRARARAERRRCGSRPTGRARRRHHVRRAPRRATSSSAAVPRPRRRAAARLPPHGRLGQLARGGARLAVRAGDAPRRRGSCRRCCRTATQVELVVERWGPEHFHDPVYRRIFERLLAAAGDRRSTRSIDGLTPAEVEAVNQLLAEALPNPATHVQAWLRRLEIRALDEERDRINAMLMDPEHPLSEAEKDALVARSSSCRSTARRCSRVRRRRAHAPSRPEPSTHRRARVNPKLQALLALQERDDEHRPASRTASPRSRPRYARARRRARRRGASARDDARRDRARGAEAARARRRAPTTTAS